MNDIKISALGGQDERGKNLHFIEIDDSIFIFDVGSSHPSKGILGVNYIIPNFDYLKTNVKKIKGIFITKINDTSCGGLNFLLNELDVPIYSSELSSLVMNKSIVKRKRKFHALKPRDVIKFKNIKIEAFSTTTCFPYSLGYAIHTSIGTIIYTGDYIFDNDINTPFNTDIMHLSEIKKRSNILLLMSDASSASRKGFTSPNHKARKYISDCIKISKGRIILVCFSEDVYRIIELLATIDMDDIEIGIKDSILTDTFKFLLLNSNLSIDNSNRIKNIIDVKNLKKSIIIVSGTKEILYNKVIKIATGNDSKLDIQENDTIILSTPPSPGSELNYANVLDELARTDANVITLNDKKVWNMNASYEDIKMMNNIFRPKYFMPVRSLYKDFIKANNAVIEAGFDKKNTILLDNGDILTLTKNNYKIAKNKISVGDIFANNSINEDIASTVLDERRRLSTDGVLIVGATIDKHTKICVSTIDTQMRGVIYIKDFSVVSKDIQNIVEDKLNEKQREFQETKKYVNNDVVKEIISALKNFMRKKIGKMPIIFTIINEI